MVYKVMVYKINDNVLNISHILSMTKLEQS